MKSKKDKVIATEFVILKREGERERGANEITRKVSSNVSDVHAGIFHIRAYLFTLIITHLCSCLSLSLFLHVTCLV